METVGVLWVAERPVYWEKEHLHESYIHILLTQVTLNHSKYYKNEEC